MLTLFKAFLLLSLAGLAYLILFRLKKVLVPRILTLLLLGFIGACVVVPDIATRIAHLVGVGRGVDFVFYLAHVAWAFIAVQLYLRLLRQEAALTEIVRALSIARAESPEGVVGAGDAREPA